jgi:2-methylcitrate dehydratase
MAAGMARRNVVGGLATASLLGLPNKLWAEIQPKQSTPLADRLAAYAYDLRFQDLDADTVEQVKAHLIDTLACGIAAFDERVVRICRDVATEQPGGPSTIIGTRRKSTPELATFANGAAFRYYDLNDIYAQAGRQGGHPSDHIAVCLSVAEAERSSAEDLIVAILLAYEINCRLIDAVDLSERGWDPPVLGLPAAALAAGKLMKLPKDKLVQAVNLGINDHISLGQTRTQTLSDWKGVADAEAGRNAVFAATLARGGLTGPAPIFEGQAGFFRLVSGDADVDVGAFGGDGRPFMIGLCGMKPYPAVVHSQTAIVAAIALAKEIGPLEAVASIEIQTTRRGYQMSGSDPEKWAPKTKETADHSLPYIVARAMLDGDITNDSYAQAKLQDPSALDLMSKVTVTADASFATAGGSAPPVRITVTLKDGRRIVRQVDSVPGFGAAPATRADVERKFRSNAGARWPKSATDEILELLWSLEQTSDLSTTLAKLAF